MAYIAFFLFLLGIVWHFFGSYKKEGFATATGTVKWFNANKGYGFIAPDGGGGDLFVHISSINSSGYKNLNEGERVSFDISEDPKGFTATNVNGDVDPLSNLPPKPAPAPTPAPAPASAQMSVPPPSPLPPLPQPPSVIAPTPLIIQTLPVRTIVPAPAKPAAKPAATKPAAKKPAAKKK